MCGSSRHLAEVGENLAEKLVGRALDGVLLYCAPRGDSFPDVCSAIIAHSGKSLPAFFAAPEIYFPLILLTQVNIRDKGEMSVHMEAGLLV